MRDVMPRASTAHENNAPQIHPALKCFYWAPLRKECLGFNIIPVYAVEPRVRTHHVRAKNVGFAGLKTLFLIESQAAQDKVLGDGVHGGRAVDVAQQNLYMAKKSVRRRESRAAARNTFW